MARDVLCIPATSTLVERVFSCSRDLCDYRRNQLTAETIRAIMLVYYRQKAEVQHLIRSKVCDILDITGMTDEEIEIEYTAQIDKIQEKMELKYIPDIKPQPPRIPNRTKRNEERREQLLLRQRRLGRDQYTQTPSQLNKERVKGSQLQERNTQRSYQGLGTYNISYLDDDIEADLSPSNHQGDYELPRPRQSRDIHLSPELVPPGTQRGGILQSVQSSQVTNHTTRAGRQAQELWRNKDI